MAERKNPSLTEVLARFREAQTKTANDESGGEPAVCPRCGNPSEQCVCVPAEGAPAPEGAAAPGVEELAAAAQALENAGVSAEAAEAAADAAKDEVCDAKETLKAVADEFINEHTAALRKEAQLFGSLFAASCLEEMNKTAALQDAEQNAFLLARQVLSGGQLRKCAEDAYAHTQAVLAGASLPLTKTAAVYEEAYRVVMAKFAGFDDPEAMEAAAGHELTPEEMAEMVAAQQAGEAGEAPAEEDPLDGLSDEELAALAAQLAEEEGAQEGEAPDDPGEVTPETVAQAANMLAAAREAGDEKTASVLMPKLANDTYAAVRAALGVC